MTFYVATLAKYVLVEADNEAQAYELGFKKLSNMEGRLVTVRTVRPANEDEIELQRWDEEAR